MPALLPSVWSGAGRFDKCSLCVVSVKLTMSLPQMLADLPRACDVGSKRNAKGHTTSWIGYKLHVDTADGGIPISCIMTSASTHDSQVAIPLGTLTAGRVENLYDLMDAAYDSIEIWAHCILLGHKPIIDVNPGHTSNFLY